MGDSGGGRYSPAAGNCAGQRGRTLSCDTDHASPAVGTVGQGVQTYPEITRHNLLRRREDWVTSCTRSCSQGRLCDCLNVTCGIRAANDCLCAVLLSEGAGSLRKNGTGV